MTAPASVCPGPARSDQPDLVSDCPVNEGFRAGILPSGRFALDFEAVLVLGVLHEIKRDVADGGHILETVPGSEAAQAPIEPEAEDLLRDPGLATQSIDGNDGAGQFEAFEPRRDGRGLVRLGARRFLVEHRTLTRCLGRHEMERPASPGRVGAVARRLAVVGVGPVVARWVDRLGKAQIAQLRVDDLHHVLERALGRDAALERQMNRAETPAAPRPKA